MAKKAKIDDVRYMGYVARKQSLEVTLGVVSKNPYTVSLLFRPKKKITEITDSRDATTRIHLRMIDREGQFNSEAFMIWCQNRASFKLAAYRLAELSRKVGQIFEAWA